MAAIRIEFLPAARGDCIWVECCRPGLPAWRMLIDGGLPGSYPFLRQRLERAAAGAPLAIDLAVVTHIDSDHIGGLLPLFAAGDVRFGDIWFNGLPQLPGDEATAPQRSVAEGERLVELLSGKIGGPVLPWNRRFDGAAVMTGGDGQFETVHFEGGPTLTLLSPTPRRLLALRKSWSTELLRLQRAETSEAAPPPAAEAPLDDLATLAATDTPRDTSVANGSSIAFLLEWAGQRCLFAADAFSAVLGPALTTLANARGGQPIALDLFKLPHHGSQGNVTVPLLRVAPARHCVISTNGERFGHPDDVALARVVVTAKQPPTLWFNYAGPAADKWSNPALQAKYGFATRAPAPGTEPGITIELPQA